MSDPVIKTALGQIHAGIALLKREFSHKRFTVDGRLVGDIGEIIAAAEFDIKLDEKSRAVHDAIVNASRRHVQIKATFKDSLTFTKTPELYLGFKLFEDGKHEVVYNGPGARIFEHVKNRAGAGERQISISLSTLRKLSAGVSELDRVPKRASLKEEGLPQG